MIKLVNKFKQPRNNANRKMLGIVVGESALLVAEVGGETPAVTRVAEFAYPAGKSAENLPEMTPDLLAFMRAKGFAAGSAVVGLPAKWLIVKPKELPGADIATQLSMLRLQADAEFSSELKDLSYDVAGNLGGGAGQTTPALLVATSNKFIAMVQSLCTALECQPRAITASALVLGEQSGDAAPTDPLVLSIGPAGVELTARKAGVACALRRIAPANGSRPSVGELRRALSSLATSSNGRELLLWESCRTAALVPTSGGASGTAPAVAVSTGGASTGGALPCEIDWTALGQQVGLTIRNGSLAMLGATGTASLNGDAGRYASAVALAMAGLSDRLPIDFLHARLAPPRESAVPRWALAAGIAVLVLILAIILGVHDLNSRERELGQIQASVVKMKDQRTVAEAFVHRVSFAQMWHSGNPRYVECLRSLTRDMPDDPNTYATSLSLRETPHPPAAPQPPGTAKKPPPLQTLSGQLYGRAFDQKSGQAILDQLHKDPMFSETKSLGMSDAGRGHEVLFSIGFVFTPSAALQKKP